MTTRDPALGVWPTAEEVAKRRAEMRLRDAVGRNAYVLGWISSAIVSAAKEHSRCRRRYCQLCADLRGALAMIYVDPPPSLYRPDTLT